MRDATLSAAERPFHTKEIITRQVVFMQEKFSVFPKKTCGIRLFHRIQRRLCQPERVGGRIFSFQYILDDAAHQSAQRCADLACILKRKPYRVILPDASAIQHALRPLIRAPESAVRRFPPAAGKPLLRAPPLFVRRTRRVLRRAAYRLVRARVQKPQLRHHVQPQKVPRAAGLRVRLVLAL